MEPRKTTRLIVAKNVVFFKTMIGAFCATRNETGYLRLI